LAPLDAAQWSLADIWKFWQYHSSYICCFFSDSSGHLQWTQKRWSNIFGYWLSMFISFIVRHHTVKNQKCLLIWFTTGVRKYSWHATTRMFQQIVLLMKRLLEVFRWQTVKNQTCQFMLYLTKCRNLLS